ncbi:MAG: hypothetical protein EBQ80_00100, partial [Proteobacteria bacterium]|nr:hypothetical protein [Pseudomonadota bacterium]
MYLPPSQHGLGDFLGLLVKDHAVESVEVEPLQVGAFGHVGLHAVVRAGDVELGAAAGLGAGIPEQVR